MDWTIEEIKFAIKRMKWVANKMEKVKDDIQKIDNEIQGAMPILEDTAKNDIKRLCQTIKKGK